MELSSFFSHQTTGNISKDSEELIPIFLASALPVLRTPPPSSLPPPAPSGWRDFYWSVLLCIVPGDLAYLPGGGGHGGAPWKLIIGAGAFNGENEELLQQSPDHLVHV